MKTSTILILVGGVALLAYYAGRRVMEVLQPPPEEGITIILPPIPITFDTREEAEAQAVRLVPTIKPRIVPPGWILEFPPIEFTTPYATISWTPPDRELPLLPIEEIRKVQATLRPRVVPVNGKFGIQFEPVIMKF